MLNREAGAGYLGTPGSSRRPTCSSVWQTRRPRISTTNSHQAFLAASCVCARNSA